MKRIYLDYAATTPVLPEVLEAMTPYWSEKFGNASSIHSFGREARLAIEGSRNKVAEILNCLPEEIIFTGTTTTSDNLAILGAVYGLRSTDYSKVHLITTQIEHHGVLDVFKHLEKEGFKVTYLPVDESGLVKLDELDKSLGSETVLVSIMYANNEIGTIQPIGEISKIVHSQLTLTSRPASRQGGHTSHNSQPILHTDAAAVAEYLPLDVQKLGVDLMTLGSHKFGGPKGVGILYVKKGTKLNPITFGGHHEQGLWPGTEAVPLVVGMVKALEITKLSNYELRIKETERLRDKLIKGVLEKVPNTILTGHPTNRLPDIASFCFDGAEGEAILLRLDGEGIAASSGSACTSGELKPSHVLLACGIKQENAHGSIRFSLGRETTEEEIDYVLEKLPKIVEDLRVMAPKI